MTTITPAAGIGIVAVRFHEHMGLIRQPAHLAGVARLPRRHARTAAFRRRVTARAFGDFRFDSNFSSAFLRPDRRKGDEFGLDIVPGHFDHLVERPGEDRIALGTDFDEALVSGPIRDCAGLPKLLATLAKHGVDDALMAKVTRGNRLLVLRQS